VETGAWAEAHRILADLAERHDLPDMLADSLTLGRVLLDAYRGDVDGADGAWSSLRPETACCGDHVGRGWGRGVRALMWLVGGGLVGAFDEAMGAIGEEPAGVNVPLCLWTGGRAALWLGDAEKAGAVVEAAASFEVAWVVAA